jgi:trans-aconitate methyltransferase
MLKKIFRRDLLTRLKYKYFEAPAGYGRPIPREAADAEYASGAWRHFHELPELARQAVIVVTVSQLHQNPAVLDVGCGSGKLAQLFQPYPCRRYLGVDFSTEGIRLARTLGLKGCEFVEGDFTTWRPKEMFDVIIFSECLGYAPDPGALTVAFLPFLMPVGQMIVSHFRFGHWQAFWRRLARHLRTLESTTLTNARGQTWDVKVLQPAGRTDPSQ